MIILKETYDNIIIYHLGSNYKSCYNYLIIGNVKFIYTIPSIRFLNIRIVTNYYFNKSIVKLYSYFNFINIW